MDLLDDPFNLLRGFFTIYSLYSFIAGVSLTTLYHKSREWREAKTMNNPFKVHFNKSWIVMCFTVLVILFIGFKTQVTADLAEKTSRDFQEQVTDYKNFSKQTQDCLNELATVYKERSNLTLANEELSTKEREALAKLLVGGSQVPNDLSDAERARAWEQLLREYAKVVGPIQDQREKNTEEKKNNPIPDPTCGGMVQPPK